jgi:hypothetical protein
MPGNDSTDTGASVGARAMELALSSTQQFTDSADRLVRAIAGSSLVSDEVSGTPAQGATRSILAPWELAQQLHRSSLEWGLNAWVAWVGALGGLATATMGRGIGQVTAEPQARTPMLTSPAWATTPRPTASAERQGSRASRSSRAANATEHAVAASGSKRKRSAAKPAAKKRPRKKS